MPEPETERPVDPYQGPNPNAQPVMDSLPARLDRIAARIKAHQKGLLALAGVAQLLFLVAMAFPHASTVLTGETIFLRVVPVDPRDLFRGDYVILGYEISRVPPGGIDDMPGNRMNANDDRWQGRTVYVGLEPEEDGLHYRGTEVHFTPPPSGKFIKGTLDGSFRITFGIESYYVQEGRGRAYEDAVREHKLSAVVALGPDGSAQLRGLSIEGN